tara:strand:+ start:5527 stop:6003 length:477 start_codon:yes stop_codon:yes gene_type:complete
MKNLCWVCCNKKNPDHDLELCEYNNCEKFVPYISRGKIVKCYDGDTVTLATIIDGKRVRFNIRMLGYDCAEIRSKDLQEKMVATWAKSYITDMIYGKIVNVSKNEGYDKYGRLLLELEYNGTSVNQIMLETWGVSYFGGHKDKINWNMWDENGKKNNI